MKKVSGQEALVFGSGAHEKFKKIVFDFKIFGKKNEKGSTEIILNEEAKITDIVRDINNAGGKIGIKNNFTLKWHNGNDLDLHVECPCGTHIFHWAR